MVPLTINPIYTLYSGNLLGVALTTYKSWDPILQVVNRLIVLQRNLLNIRLVTRASMEVIVTSDRKLVYKFITYLRGLTTNLYRG